MGLAGPHTINVRRVEAPLASVWFVPKKTVTITIDREGNSGELGERTVRSSDGAVTVTPVTQGPRSCALRALSTNSTNLVRKFDQYDQAFNGGLGYATFNNLEGKLAHGESHWMDSYIVMFRATNNEKYITKAIEHADRVLIQRDNRIHVTNWRGEKLGIWSRSDASGATNGPFPHLVESGLITAPIAELAAVIKSTPCLQNLRTTNGRTYLAVADEHIAAVNEVIAYHNREWHTDTRNGNGIGWFSTPPSSFATFVLPAGKPPPVNYVTAMGETLAHMHKATGNTSYLDQARRIAYWVLEELEYHPGADAYWLRYWPQMDYYPDDYTYNDTTPEDVGHLAYTMGFMEAMTRYGMGVFDAQVSGRVARAVSRLMFDQFQGGFQFGMNGTGGDCRATLGTTCPYWAGFYLFLNQWDSAIRPAVEYALITQKSIDTTAPSTEGMFSLAHYILHMQ